MPGVELTAELDCRCPRSSTTWMAYADPSRRHIGSWSAGTPGPCRGNFSRLWQRTLTKGVVVWVGCTICGNTGQSSGRVAGTSTRELMSRMGHARVRAALIYQHLLAKIRQVHTDNLGLRRPPGHAELVRQGEQVASRAAPWNGSCALTDCGESPG